MKKYTDEEKQLILAGVLYAQKENISKTKLAWSLSSLTGKPDNMLYQQIVGISKKLAEGDSLDDFEEIVSEEEPFVEDMLENRIGDIVKARVVAVKTYGALCSVENSTRTLLLHVSELADEYIDDVNNYISAGDEFYALLILSSSNNRLALSTKRLGTVSKKKRETMLDE